MSGAPGLHQIKRLGAADLPDGDAVRAQAKGGAHQIGQGHRTVPGAQRHGIGRRALQFADVLDENDPVVAPRHLSEQGVDQGRLAAGGAPDHEDVAALGDGVAQALRLPGDHDPGGDIVVEGEDGDGRFADGEGRRAHNGRKEAFEPLPGFRQFGRDAGTGLVDLLSDVVGHQSDDPLALGGLQAMRRQFKPARQPIQPDPAVRIEHDFHHIRVRQRGQERRAKGRAEHFQAARLRAHGGPVGEDGSAGDPDGGDKRTANRASSTRPKA
ncbi:hypothetical protein D3C71_1102530 [compost metagenome]